jgi:uncharacterized protein
MPPGQRQPLRASRVVPEGLPRGYGARVSSELTRELFRKFSANDLDGVMAMLADDVTWRIPGKPELFPGAGLYNKKRIEKLFRHMDSRLVNGLQFTVLSTIAEGDRVAVEVDGVGDLKDGRAYRQQYHLAITFRDGLIASVHEYLDTHHAWDVWVRT